LLEELFLSISLVNQGRQTLLEKLSSLKHDFIRGLATGASSNTWLNAENGIDNLLRLLVLEGNIGILMKTEDFRVLDQRKLLNIVHVDINGAVGRSIVNTRLRELVAFFENLRVRILPEESYEAATIPIISDTTTVVDLTGDVEHGIPRDFFLLIKEDLQHSGGCFEVGVIEVVSDVPTEGTELPSLLKDSMEERETENELLPSICLIAIV
jgi:hypothetical protein